MLTRSFNTRKWASLVINKSSFCHRMNLTITKLANSVVYGGLLECGNDAVGNATVSMQDHDTYVCDSFGADSWIAST